MPKASNGGKGRSGKTLRMRRRHEKPDFETGEGLLSSVSYPELYRRFRAGGLGRADAAFNALYTVISEKHVKLMEERMRAENAVPTAEHKNAVHPFSLRLLAFFPRAFRRLADLWRALGRRLFHRDPGGSSYRASYRFFRTHIPHALTVVFLLVCAALIVRALTVPVVLQAQIDGRVIGAVESNAAVDSALRELEENVSGILGKSFQFPFEIKYTFARDEKIRVIDKNGISEILYSYLPDFICTGTGLYVDGNLVAVCETEQEVRGELKAITQDRVGGGSDVGIFNDILVVTQAYPTDSVIDQSALRALLEEMTVPPEERGGAVPREDGTENALTEQTATDKTLLCDMEIPTVRLSRKSSNQPVSIDGIHLTFYRSQVLRYQEEVPFNTVYTESSNLYTTMGDVTTFGVTGKNNVEARVYYVDGREVRRDILSETRVKAPVDQVVTMGTRVLPEELGITGVRGRFIMPRVAAISSPYGERESGFHRGWDIPGPEGANIYAAASGTVVAAIGQDGGFTYLPGTMFASYGYCVLIEHEDGYYTMYAHCSRINVTLGQEVKQGEKIAEVGETGEAYGPHVHFEIRYGNERLDPAAGFMYEGKTTIYDVNTTVAAPADPDKKGSAGSEGAV